MCQVGLHDAMVIFEVREPSPHSLLDLGPHSLPHLRHLQLVPKTYDILRQLWILGAIQRIGNAIGNKPARTICVVDLAPHQQSTVHHCLSRRRGQLVRPNPELLICVLRLLSLVIFRVRGVGVRVFHLHQTREVTSDAQDGMTRNG